MRKTLAATLVIALVALGMPAGAFAAGPTGPKRQNAPGTVTGDAKNANGDKLAQTKVRIRNSDTGQVAADLTTDSAGTFTGSVPAGHYVVEIVGANGSVIGLSPMLTVVAGTTATVSVTASAIGAVTAGAASGGFGIFGLGTITSIAVLGGAATALTFGIVAATKTASPSR
jgi:hypothetical protein